MPWPPLRISDNAIRELYVEQKLSSKQISHLAGCSEGGISYRLKKMGIEKRNMSEATYARSNPNGDPFKFRMPLTAEEWQLFGLGLGLYWGEGAKTGKSSVSICNSDPRLLNAFKSCMTKFFGVKPDKARVQLHIFGDINSHEALEFWSTELRIDLNYFSKPFIIPSGSIGTYRTRSTYGTATISYHNVKLLSLLLASLNELASAFGEQKELKLPMRTGYHPIARKD